MREVVRPWLEMTSTGTGGHRGKTVFTLTAHTLGSLATGNRSPDWVIIINVNFISQDEKNSPRS